MSKERKSLPETSAAAARLQQALEALVGELKQRPKALAVDFNRRLCRLARAHRVSPEEFRSRLVRAGLKPERASELKVVLRAKNVCRAFLALNRPESWEMTLANARHRQLREDYGLKQPDLLGARVAGLLHHCRLTRLSVPGGTLTVAACAADLQALISNSRQPGIQIP